MNTPQETPENLSIMLNLSALTSELDVLGGALQRLRKTTEPLRKPNPDTPPSPTEESTSPLGTGSLASDKLAFLTDTVSQMIQQVNKVTDSFLD